MLVTFDTTRADHLDLYGGPTPTPNLRALAEDGLIFEQAFTSVPITLPSHSTLMTGKAPMAHGVRDNGLFTLGERQTTLAEILSSAGYATAAAVGSFPLTSKFGIHQGFDLFDDHLTAPLEDVFGDRVLEKKRLFFDERPAGRVNEALLPWLDEHAQSPFFLWAHYFDPHHPHTPPAPYDQIYAHDLYAGEIAYADEALGALVDALKRHGVYDRTIIVVTADHGEGRGEHNESTHSLLAYNSTLHVPLIVKPAAEEMELGVGRRFAARVGLVDVLPTVLDWLGLDIPEDLQGRSLVPPLGSDVEAPRDRVLYAETLSPRIGHEWGELRALFVEDLKYIHGPRPELFDLAADPRELNNLVASRPKEAEEMKRKLEIYLERNAVSDLDSSVAIDEETAQRLMALGYVQASGLKVGAISEVLRDDGDAPQDRAVTIGIYSQAKQFLYAGQWLNSRENLERLLRLDPDNSHYMDLLALAEARLGRTDRALEILESIPHDAKVPTRAKVLESMGNLRLSKGERQAALERYRDAEALGRSSSGQWRIAELYRETGDIALSERHLRAALEEDASFAPAHISLAITQASRGDVAAARESFIQALEAHPYSPRGHYNYAVFLLNQEEAEVAIEHVSRAVNLSPDYHQARYALLEMLVHQGREDEAIEEYLELANRAPRSAFTEQAAELLGINL